MPPASLSSRSAPSSTAATVATFADDVQNGLYAGATLADAINAATQRWMGWTIGRSTSKQYGIPKGLPYLTGFVIHCEITELSVEESLAA